jgi:hypothetical protein
LLREIIDILKTEDAPLSVDNLSHRLDVDKPALEGMLETLLKKGIIKTDDIGEFDSSKCYSSSCLGCAAVKGCPFAGKLPRTYTLVDLKR